MTYFKTWQTRSGNKYKAVKTTYGGSIYDSKREVTKAMELNQMVKDKQIKSWEKQVKIELRGEFGTRICNYFCDFLITHNDGTLEYLEIKSKATVTPVFRIKWKLLCDQMQHKMKTGEVKLTIEY